MENVLTWMNLQLMAEGGGGDASGGEAAPQGAQTAEVAAESPPDLEKEFDALVKGEGKYKDVFGKRVASMVNKRMQGTQETVKKYNAMTPMLEVLAARYETTVDDPALIDKVANDPSLLENRALRNGSTADVELRLTRAQAAERRANDVLRGMMARQDAEKWQTQAESLKREYPDFDLDASMQDPKFRDLLTNPSYHGMFDVKTAFFAIHGDEAVAQAAQNAQKRTAAAVAAGKTRPRENGIGSQAGAVVRTNPAEMSKTDLKKYMDMVARGEKVSFG